MGKVKVNLDVLITLFICRVDLVIYASFPVHLILGLGKESNFANREQYSVYLNVPQSLTCYK